MSTSPELQVAATWSSRRPYFHTSNPPPTFALGTMGCPRALIKEREVACEVVDVHGPGQQGVQ